LVALAFSNLSFFAISALMFSLPLLATSAHVLFFALIIVLIASLISLMSASTVFVLRLRSGLSCGCSNCCLSMCSFSASFAFVSLCLMEVMLRRWIVTVVVLASLPAFACMSWISCMASLMHSSIVAMRSLVRVPNRGGGGGLNPLKKSSMFVFALLLAGG